MPYKSPGNVFNPRAHKYFHPTGSNDIRLTQPPSVFQLPPLPAKTSVNISIFLNKESFNYILTDFRFLAFRN